MRRRLFTLGAVASAVLCVLSVRSCWVVDHARLETPARAYSACSYQFLRGPLPGCAP